MSPIVIPEGAVPVETLPARVVLPVSREPAVPHVPRHARRPVPLLRRETDGDITFVTAPLADGPSQALREAISEHWSAIEATAQQHCPYEYDNVAQSDIFEYLVMTDEATAQEIAEDHAARRRPW